MVVERMEAIDNSMGNSKESTFKGCGTRGDQSNVTGFHDFEAVAGDKEDVTDVYGRERRGGRGGR